MASQLLTLAEVAAFLKCSRSKVRYLTTGGGLPAVRVGRALRYRVADVEQFLNDHRVA